MNTGMIQFNVFQNTHDDVLQYYISHFYIVYSHGHDITYAAQYSTKVQVP